MADPYTLLVMAAASLAGLGIAAWAVLRGWQGWLELRRLQIENGRGSPGASPTARIEVADLKERIRKLEAIANGTQG